MTNVAWLMSAFVMPRRRVVAALLAVIGLILGAWSTVAAQGRLTVNLASKPSIVKQVSWIPPTSQPQFHVDFEGDKQKWWFVKITSYAATTDVHVDGTPSGYFKNEVLTKGVWYSFKEKLSVVFSLLKGNAPATAKFEFSIGYADGLPIEAKPEEARSYGTRGDNISLGKGGYSIELYWGEPAEIIPDRSKLDLETSDKVSPKEVPFEVSSSDPLWKFVQFKPPSGMALKLDPDNDPESITATSGDPIDSGTWYGFKGKMKLKLSSDTSEVGSVQNLEIDARRQTPDVSNIEEARDAIARHRLQADNQPKAVSVAIKRPKDFLTENWPLMVVALLAVLVLLGLLIAPKGEEWIRASRLSKQHRTGMNTNQQATSMHPSRVLQGHKKSSKKSTKKTQDDFSKAPETRTTPTPIFKSSSADRELQVDSHKPAIFPDPNVLYQPGQQVEEERKHVPPSASGATSVVDSQSVRKLIAEELTKQSLSTKAETRVSDMIAQTAKILRDELAQSELDAEGVVKDIEKRIDTHQQSAVDALTKEIKGQLDDFIRVLDNNSRKDDDKTDPNPLYSKLLGHLFGIKVDDLREGVFQEKVESVNTALNEYLKNELPRAESLKDIRAKSDNIHQALCKLRDKTASLGSGIDTELRTVVEAAGEIAADTDKLQSQLQNRTPALEVRLRIPVPAHEGARYTFIEELGFAIKGELDRIRDPESYYRRRLDRLVTGDIINLAELCDKQVAGGPGRNPDIERALQALFTAAGLRSILPKEGQDFAPAEQTLIQINANKSGKSQTVAEVVSRGFAYKDGQKEVVLRRAGVKIYR